MNFTNFQDINAKFNEVLSSCSSKLQKLHPNLSEPHSIMCSPSPHRLGPFEPLDRGRSVLLALAYTRVLSSCASCSSLAPRRLPCSWTPSAATSSARLPRFSPLHPSFLLPSFLLCPLHNSASALYVTVHGKLPGIMGYKIRQGVFLLAGKERNI